ncbi:helix-turn-helix domain-containing protein [Lactiplantibacillus mudanjiangensis]|uniref:Transcriptional regulator [Lactobacillus sp.] n=1 Tax=Lactiplantibacillus mudanjiangensis TaxID=1296538 RepID=A0A660E2Z1_9LACO|nr:helix-turn-helix transcriptional regulator [Lactiplantibacillus mudanjiangensis]VDG20000.1 transcriptional regulator [Lactobacillus sp.] [Lactiplantibacillus mudanjiangensis]VDG26162.1 transcriptional regulator [Lactobacillus sp.] [Lactiplantibacillus mudanjiangensis]VDG27313.1 transcriptional regulator [Lactobacillus sp.] [Lactiplantibacillus mudanjiangensis]VDG33395.1 transcriptional regulator [Lactobacillus sp.] [Lactiplantibacillus mudanjiangensis]
MKPDNDVLLLAYFKQNHITQQDLANAINRSVNTVWNKLHGRSQWNTTEVQQLHDEFGVPTQYFFRD